MRTNLPVTGNEVPLKDDTLIVSKTNTKGQITYINKDFLEISGFTEQELINEPHNIVRHPDMPVEAFEDMWRDLKAGRPWTGYVKNRCKNGDHYWVLANATPIWEHGTVTGYMSVRRKPDPAVVAEVERAYRLFREGKAGGLQIHHGKVVKGSGRSVHNFPLAKKLGVLVGFLVLVLIIQGLIGLSQIASTNSMVADGYTQGTEPTRIIGRIGKLMADNRAQVYLALQHDPAGSNAKMHDHPTSMHADAVKKNAAEITSLWEAYTKSITDDTERKLASEYAELRGKFVKEGLLESLAMIERGDFAGANGNALQRMNPHYTAAAGKADEIFAHLAERAKQQFVSSQTQYDRVKLLTAIGLLLAVSLAAVFGSWLVRSITVPLKQVVDALMKVAQGDYSSHIDVSRDDEIGKAMQGLQATQTRLGFEVAETKRQADEMTRVKIALDNVSTGVMIANRERVIIYANNSVKKILKGAEAAIKQQLPNFDADNMIGVNIDTFHKNPKHQADLLGTFTQTYVANLEIGGNHLRVSASPVINAAGERLGAVAEWLDRTAEIRVEQEVENLIMAAGRGNFDARLEVQGKEGFFRKLAEGLNQLSMTVSTGLTDVAGVLQAIAQGDLTKTIDADYEGIFGQLKDDTNTTIHRLREVIGQIKEATDLINTAAKEIAAGNTDLSSRTEEQASSLEETASSMEELNSTVKQNAENATQANTLARNSNDTAVKSGEMVQQIVTTMNGISQSSKKIADIIGVIDSIAFQTNILALNAAVEAARAGEQGRGFAVVATEVRNLAQRSATAAKEIKELIAESTGQVDAGTRLVDQAGSSMTAVVSSFQQVTGLVTDIANASREQASGIEQVTQAVGQMDEVTQQNAALVEQAAAAAESLEEQARALVQAVSMFKLDEGGGRQLPGPALRTAPAQKQLAPRPVAKPGPAQSSGRKLPPPHLANDNGDEWEEF